VNIMLIDSYHDDTPISLFQSTGYFNTKCNDQIYKAFMYKTSENGIKLLL
jgi:hypothetical protein